MVSLVYSAPFEFDGDHVEERELARVVSSASKSAQDASALPIQNP